MAAWLLACALAVALALTLLLLRSERSRAARERAQTDRLASELQRLQAECSRLAPAGLVQRLASEGTEPVAERKVITALFADLVGYTALSESLDAPVLARVLNGYFQRAADAITQNRGRISTFLGDGILAYFGALEPNPWQCNDAVHAALGMRAAMRAYADELAREGLPRIEIGIGIHRGPGLAGLIGSRDRMEYSVVGRTVNLAARVQSLTRTHGVDILVTEEVRTELDPRFRLRALPPASVKGIAEPVVTYAIEG